MCFYDLPGIPFDAFSDEIMIGIVAVYDRVTGRKNSIRLLGQHPATSALNHLKRGGSAEYRFGSSISAHSKLWIHRTIVRSPVPFIRFDFDPNTSDDDAPRCVEMRRKFLQEVKEYLKSKELAV